MATATRIGPPKTTPATTEAKSALAVAVEQAAEALTASATTDLRLQLADARKELAAATDQLGQAQVALDHAHAAQAAADAERDRIAGLLADREGTILTQGKDLADARQQIVWLQHLLLESVGDSEWAAQNLPPKPAGPPAGMTLVAA